VADVGGQHLEHVVAQGAGLVELERRDAQALLPDLRRPRVVRAVRGAADVALVGAVDGPEEQPVAGEHRHERRQVGQVVVAVIRVVQQEHVTGRHAAREEIAHGLHRPRDRADVDRHVLGLGDQARAGVAHGRGEVAAGVEDLGVGRSEHRLAHLLDNRLESMV
jgi:hypothetical protein